MRSLRRLLWLLLLIPAPLQLRAQGHSVWDANKKATAGIQDKAAKAATGLRAWKAQLAHWGLDSTYNRSLSIGGRLNSDGWSGNLVYGRRGAAGRLGIWQIGFSEVKHEKETKLQGGNGGFPELGAGTPYIYGKRNNLYLLQLSYSRERPLLPAVLDGNVAIGFRYGGGLSLALLKPYYLRLIYPDYTMTPAMATVRDEAFTTATSERFLNPSLILGRGKWSEGLDQLDSAPGLHLECAVLIMPARRGAFIQTISLGAQGAYFTKPLPVLVDNAARAYRVCLFAGLELGKRWLR